MKNVVLSILAVGLLLTAASCSKTGTPGPVGPQGATGATGNANVIGEPTFTVTSWTPIGNTYNADITNSDITADVVNKGVVEVYKYYPNSGWTNLPDINGGTSTVFTFGLGGYTITVETTDGSTVNNPGSVTFRDVVIPSSVRLAYPHTNWKNYYEATATLEKAKIDGISSGKN